jgi:hypothetical protein
MIHRRYRVGVGQSVYDPSGSQIGTTVPVHAGETQASGSLAVDLGGATTGEVTTQPTAQTGTLRRIIRRVRDTAHEIADDAGVTVRDVAEAWRRLQEEAQQEPPLPTRESPPGRDAYGEWATIDRESGEVTIGGRSRAAWWIVGGTMAVALVLVIVAATGE